MLQIQFATNVGSIDTKNLETKVAALTEDQWNFFIGNTSPEEAATQVRRITVWNKPPENPPAPVPPVDGAKVPTLYLSPEWFNIDFDNVKTLISDYNSNSGTIDRVFLERIPTGKDITVSSNSAITKYYVPAENTELKFRIDNNAVSLSDGFVWKLDIGESPLVIKNDTAKDVVNLVIDWLV